ncbi:MAG: hypothetical protein GF310_08155 [candidate division Zixibacteria bacterium]|nr:hypothetical protein [candidate division Zixibacteria bacterium]
MNDFDKDFEKYLNLYLDGRLDEKEAEEFEKFLAQNPEKAEDLEAYKTLDYTAKGELLPELPEGYWEGLESRVNKRIEKIPEYKSSWVGFKEKYFSFNRFMKIAASATVIVMAFMVSWHLIKGFRVLDTGADEAMYMDKSPAVLNLEETPPSGERRTEFERMADSAFGGEFEGSVPLSAEDLDLSEARKDELEDLAETDETPPTVPELLEDDVKAAGEPEPKEKKEPGTKAIPKEKTDKEVTADVSQELPEIEPMAPVPAPVEMDSPAPIRTELERADVGEPMSLQSMHDEVQAVPDTTRSRMAEEYADMLDSEPGVLATDSIGFAIQLDDFPYLALNEYSFSKQPPAQNKSAQPEGIVMTETEIEDSAEILLRAEGDSLIEAYNIETNSEIKAALLKEIIEKSLEIVKLTKSEADMLRTEMLLKKAMGSRAITFPQYREYNDSLRQFMRLK